MSLLRRLRRLKKRRSRSSDLGEYAEDLLGYCRDVLRVRLTPAQEAITRLLSEPPYKVLCRAGHNVGKSFLAACVVSWWFDTHRPSVCLTTAPTDRQVKDILWKEVRRVRSRVGLGGFAGPKAPRLESAADHFAHGFTARDGDRFQGHHESSVLIVFDEAEGVEPIFWEAAESMLGGDRYGMLCFYNPTMQSGPTADAERQDGWHQVSMSSLDHPNIAAELEGKPPPYPSAIRLGRLREMLGKWATPIRQDEAVAGDVNLGTEWFRPGPVAEARLLGRRPTAAFNAVWPVAVFDLCERLQLPNAGPVQIGCDVARYGDDFTAIHTRRGGSSLRHQSFNGLSVPQAVQLCKQAAMEAAKLSGAEPKRVPIAVDDAGVGGGVTDGLRHDGFAAVPVLGAGKSPNEAEFPNYRSALWFHVADAARAGLLSLASLPQQVRQELRRQLTAPLYTLDVRGRRVVEPKDATKARIGRSPDDADALLLAYANLGPAAERVAGRIHIPR